MKCPATFIGKGSSAENYKHLEIINGQPYLKRASPCDFFVFSFKGNLNIRVKFGGQFWIELLDNLDWFFRNFTAPELLLGKMKKNLDRICDENHIIVVEHRDYEIMQHAFENSEVTSQVSLLEDIAENVDIEIHKN